MPIGQQRRQESAQIERMASSSPVWPLVCATLRAILVYMLVEYPTVANNYLCGRWYVHSQQIESGAKLREAISRYIPS